MYKWVDDKGNIYFSDQVPPSHSQYRRETLGKNGRTVAVTEKAKTKSEEALDRLLKALKEAQEKVIAQQLYHDKALRITYTKLEDLQNSYKVKLQEMDTEQKLSISNLKRLDNQLETLNRQAATHERNGEKIPKSLLDPNRRHRKRKPTSLRQDQPKHRKKNKVVEQFNDDIARYKQLTHTVEQQRMDQQREEIKAANQLGFLFAKTTRNATKPGKLPGTLSASIQPHPIARPLKLSQAS